MITKIAIKIAGLYTVLRHRNVEPSIRYFYRDTYYCQLVQLKYFFRDYFQKKKYKIITFNGEFGQELLFVLPFAYWHFKNGTLKKTISTKYSAELYYFSGNHEEYFSERSTKGNYNYEMPRILYSHDYNMRKWLPPPYKKIYSNNIFVYEKPIVIIANRYNTEWDGPPISFFDLPTLGFLIDKLKETYQVIYNRPVSKNIINDNSDIRDLNEIEWIKEHHPEVIIMEELYKKHKAEVNNFNHFQLMVYANSNHFISIHGGTATLASYFGGVNLILSKRGLEHYFNCFQKLFTRLSGAIILHAKEEKELKHYIEEYYLKPHAK